MKHPLLVSGTLIVCSVLAGCTAQEPSEPTSAPSGTSAASAPAIGGAPSPSGAPSTPSAAGETPSGPATPAAGERCHTSELKASIGPNSPGAGQSNFALVLTNASDRTCTVRGYPGLAFVNGKGEQITPDPEREPSDVRRTVTLAPGAGAWSGLTYGSPAISGVTTVTPEALLITPPDETTSISVPWTGGEVSNTGKASVPRVSPLRPGDGP
ncbi:uncharacterized protein DUF4232 [Actinocorallia herbida]|uniref:Uncharacterized protein DUF4232 n=1 Tax=Actinocorallia herbida TaxID=58109 RepID=A0A3N1CVG9_9ACTN|nr:DUF4232 domain-containing protein [Actinocorallia herbida]ROO85299.1 uncharacterized protein DUF4232 [Actinocorallia herbida]